MPKWRTFVRSLIPPVVMHLARAIRSVAIGKGCPTSSSRCQFIWEGVYGSLHDVPVSGPGFGGQEWIASCECYLAEVLARLRSGHNVLNEWQATHLLLPLLVSSLRSCSAPVRVLDFGGGPGIDYVFLRSMLGETFPLEYVVVEASAVCALAKAAFADDRAIHFATSLPDPSEHFDVVYASNVLQYVADYHAIVLRLCRQRSRYLLASRHPAGDIATFATAQMNVPGSVLAAWFFRTQDLVDIVVKEGYFLRYRSYVKWPYDMSNFSPERRLDSYCNLLFSREDAGNGARC